MVSIAIPTFFTAVCWSLIAAAVALVWLTMINAVLLFVFTILKEDNFTNGIVEIIHNVVLILSIGALLSYIGYLLQVLANEKG